MDHITTQKIEIAYDEIVIVENLDLAIPEGKITSIIGPNGCGKSTVLKAIGRILKPKSGTILLEGEDIKKYTTKEIAKKMAILPQTPTAPSGLTVKELVTYGRFPHQNVFGKLKEEDLSIVDWAIEITKLKEFEYREVDALSGGQRQRVWIAMALAQQSDLILLDEPTTYLDLSHQMEIMELLYELNKTQKTTIAMVLHDLNLAARYSDYMIAIRKGAIVKRGTPHEVMTEEILRRTFCIKADIGIQKNTGRPICISYDLLSE